MNTSSYVAPAFWRELSALEDTLMLDFDGTLAPFCADRLQVRAYPGVTPVLEEIVDRGTRIIFVSGRPCAELEPLLGFRRWHELWGSHGLERMLPGGRVVRFHSDEESLTRTNLIAILKDVVGPEYVEVKECGVAVHWRGMYAERATRTERLLRELAQDAVRSGEARLLPFCDGLEVRFTRRTKGDAVRELIRSVSARAELAYLGDDITDEDAFEAMNGRGLTVLVRDEYRPTKAKQWLRPPEELLRFLRDWRDRRRP